MCGAGAVCPCAAGGVGQEGEAGVGGIPGERVVGLRGADGDIDGEWIDLQGSVDYVGDEIENSQGDGGIGVVNDVMDSAAK